ncbi:MAG: hypothetical protein ACREOO_20660 [bacterium]
MRPFFKFVFLVLLIPVIYAFVMAAWSFLVYHAELFWENWVTYGFIFYILLYVLLLRPRVTFLEIFEHELAHTVAALLFFRSVKLFAVFPEGGVMRHQGGSSSLVNTIITLAPYFLPVFALPMLLVKPFMTSPMNQVVDFFIGLFLAFHYASLFVEFSPRQSDIVKTELVVALFVVIFFNAIFTVLALSFALGEYDYLMAYIKDALATAWRSYQAIGLELISPHKGM